jgi:hypothetical protein
MSIALMRAQRANTLDCGIETTKNSPNIDSNIVWHTLLARGQA